MADDAGGTDDAGATDTNDDGPTPTCGSGCGDNETCIAGMCVVTYCLTHNQCGSGGSCFAASCEFPEPLADCAAPAVAELPIPDFDEPLLDLHFANVDADPAEELLVLRAGDHDGEGPDELALLDAEGALHLWSVAP